MNIVELIKHLKSIEVAEKLINETFPNVEFDLVDLYMVEKLSLESKIVFFNAETIDNGINIYIDTVKYVNLFPLNLAQEMVEELHKSDTKLNDFEIAKRLLDYRLKDA